MIIRARRRRRTIPILGREGKEEMGILAGLIPVQPPSEIILPVES